MYIYIFREINVLPQIFLHTITQCILKMCQNQIEWDIWQSNTRILCGIQNFVPGIAKGVHFPSYQYFSLNLKFSFHCYVFAFFSFFSKWNPFNLNFIFWQSFMSLVYFFSSFFSYFFFLYKHDSEPVRILFQCAIPRPFIWIIFFLPSRLTPTLRL